VNRLSGVLLFLLVAATVSCNKNPGVSPLATVSGTVLLDGNPMPEGEIRFSMLGEPPRSLEVRDGKFSGEASVGDNRVEVVSEQEGEPHPMDPSQRLKENIVDPQFWGPNTTLKQNVPSGGASDLKFEVTSRR
jgi:hypothetical protein